MTWLYSSLICAFLFQAGNPPPQSAKPLPDLEPFLQGVRKHLQSDRSLLSRYTYIERSTFRELDSSGKVKKTQARVWEVYPSLEERFTYRKLVSKDGKPISAEEIEKHDRAYDKKIAEERRKHELESPADKRRREAKAAEAKRKDEEILDETFRVYKITMTGREELDGQSAIVLAFEPRPEYQPKTTETKILARLHGKAWVGESDQEVIRIDVELSDNISMGLGLLAKMYRGSRMVFQRRRVNNEIWLPAEAHFTGTGRLLVLKGFRIDVVTTYSEYKKFSVETSVRFEDLKKP
jgi:hypothetical protein